MRHTLAHILAQAVLEQYPTAKLTLGPAVDNGFYYDIDFGDTKISDNELKTFQTAMRKNLKKWTEFTHKEVSESEALEAFAGNEYKIELIKEIGERGEKITLYTCGGFTDLCRGGHLENPAAEISADSFKLDRIAGAYWRGDEKNKMLTRIYGLAFESGEKLQEYITAQEEARKRDHRKLGRELGLFSFSDLVGPGLPLFSPKGVILRNQIINFSRELNNQCGYQEVHTPNMNRAELFKTSGHYDKYKEDMFQVCSHYTDDEYYLKPMNCPQHTQIFASETRSYRDLPVRFSDFAMLYRDERPGELSGLTRLRAFAQDDGHAFVTEDQIEGEFKSVLGAIKTALSTYGLDYHVRLSLHDPENKQKYLGTAEVWEKSESLLRNLLEEMNITYVLGIGEAAFYGPKMDIIAKDGLGREWQISTIQIDFNLPERFDLKYTDKDGSLKRPIMIHRALVGSPDRFMAILIEHFAGAFPVWLSPVQVAITPVRENHEDTARSIEKQLRDLNIRVSYQDSSENLGKRIRTIKNQKTPYTIIIGDKDIEAGMITVETRGVETGTQVKLEDFIEKITKEIKEKSLG